MTRSGENWHFCGRELDCSKPVVMGIVNVTPDSFSDGGNFLNMDLAVKHAGKLVSEGADILDIGGESTRPGSVPVTAADEIARVIPVIEGIKSAGIEVPISIASISGFFWDSSTTISIATVVHCY